MPTGINEGEALSKLKASRNPEPETAPTEEPDVVNVSEEDAPIEEVEQKASQEEESQSLEIEESEGSSGEEATNADDLFYVDLDGEEITSEQIREWKNGHMMQSDYTRKRQEDSQKRKDVDALEASLKEKESKLDSRLATLEAMTQEEIKTPEELAEMREYEPEAYIEYTEKQAKRQQTLKELKQSKPSNDIQAEQAKIVQANPHWVQDGKATEAYTKDMEMLTGYAQKKGFSDSEIKLINGNSNIALAIIEAARNNGKDIKKAIVEKKVRKAPVSTKPKQAVKTSLVSDIEKQEKLVRSKGRPEDFVKLRQLKRQLNN